MLMPGDIAAAVTLARLRNRKVTSDDARCFIDMLDDNCLHIALGFLDKHSLAAASLVSDVFYKAVQTAAELYLRARRPNLPAASVQCICWLRCLAGLRNIENIIGPKPEHNWRRELVELHLKAEALASPTYFDDPAFQDDRRYEYEHGLLSYNKQLEGGEEAIQYCVDCGGWTREGAIFIDMLGGGDSAITWSIHPDRLSKRDKQRFAATIHMLFDVIFVAAWQAPTVCELVYASLCNDSQTGLTHVDEVYMPEELLALGVGNSVVVAGGWGSPACADNFRDEHGIWTYDPTPDSPDGFNDADYHALDADIIAFRCRPPDRFGFHAPVRHPRPPMTSAGYPCIDEYLLPPHTTITLEHVAQPGEWVVRGLRVKRRLFTVSVTFGC